MRKLNGNSWYVPRGAKRPDCSLSERLKLFERMYVGIWFRKLRYARRKGDWSPLRSL